MVDAVRGVDFFRKRTKQLVILLRINCTIGCAKDTRIGVDRKV